MLMGSKHFRRYCKECGNVTQLERPAGIHPNKHYTIIMLGAAAIILLILEIAHLRSK